MTELNNTQRAAVLLLALDEDSAAEVFKHLSAREVQEVSQEMAKLGNISHDQMRQVLDDFYDESEQFAALNLYSSDHIRSVLTKALGNERASSLLEDILEQNGANSGIDALNLMEANIVSEMIRDEHPQIIATILVHLERRQAADVLEYFDDKLRNDVVLRIATFSGVQPAALQELTEVLGGMLDGQNLKRSKMGGARTAAEILNLMNSSAEETVIETVRAHSEDLAQKIIDEMFLFENLLDVDDRGIQLLLKEINTNALMVALKGSDEKLKEKFLRNMSTRAATLLREDMEASGPIRVSQVESEQKAILQVVRRLADNGEIVLTGGDDAYV
ncbi:MAG: flagellar motor switch protein FliG [Alcanivorax sp.]|jgi:flagellar motor switch protein FliG|uniref:Flagellar motor switch protein FliG n=1 Tax=Alloalcanivorax venustensis ISO4 TaxID=1177184 RepID=A0ABS0AJD6_9GAMM|nr:flagellar motor switch protein FliG [Alloalcanivorax venustensis]MAK23488.1 flagellar motor switch protein FliG [Alcanivorax sp.]MED5601049.1 flagellar motor switch protein FliG [Pseudomonadota bacterium]SMO50146.1 flagellar motor switch protein FliG [Alcanivorax sp. DSM 26295]MBA4731057.1 flagellar motor switch protein FliG [Alcanivorax sp.]MBD3651309.1 flagellar motor switch protein FliG [Alcanivorax sp.]|tara:strand:- start:8324 stop:9319 length:996 start_codon:yes stop_codon:yes gene_type:complete